MLTGATDDPGASGSGWMLHGCLMTGGCSAIQHLIGRDRPREIELETVHGTRLCRQVGEVLADPAPIIQDAPGHPSPGRGLDQAQSSILPGPPDVGRLTAFGGLAHLGRFQRDLPQDVFGSAVILSAPLSGVSAPGGRFPGDVRRGVSNQTLVSLHQV